MIGLKRDTVDIVPYASEWVLAFQAEAVLLRKALGQRTGAIEHIGSTAVAEMPSKPIIDLMAAVADLNESIAT